MFKESTKNIIAGNWNELKGGIQAQWGKLTDNDLDQINGDTNKLYGYLLKNYGLAQKDAEAQLDLMVKQLDS